MQYRNLLTRENAIMCCRVMMFWICILKYIMMALSLWPPFYLSTPSKNANQASSELRNVDIPIPRPRSTLVQTYNQRSDSLLLRSPQSNQFTLLTLSYTPERIECLSSMEGNGNRILQIFVPLFLTSLLCFKWWQLSEESQCIM